MSAMRPSTIQSSSSRTPTCCLVMPRRPVMLCCPRPGIIMACEWPVLRLSKSVLVYVGISQCCTALPRCDVMYPPTGVLLFSSFTCHQHYSLCLFKLLLMSALTCRCYSCSVISNVMCYELAELTSL